MDDLRAQIAQNVPGVDVEFTQIFRICWEISKVPPSPSKSKSSATIWACSRR